MPVAIVIGADPLCSIVSAVRFGRVSEADYAGGLHQEPVELVKCETNDLLVPAHAEIVLEGELLIDVQLNEGPFGEFTGYRCAGLKPRAVYRIDAVTFRDDPILTMSCMGKPVHDANLVDSVASAMHYKRLLIEQGIPVTDLYMPPETAPPLLVVVGVKSLANYANIATAVGNIISVHGGGVVVSKVIVVDEDVDVFNLGEVWHALSTRCHPVRGIKVSDREVSQTDLVPWLSPEDRKWRKGARVTFDCTWPLEWSPETEVPVNMSFDQAYPSEIRNKVRQNWENYGFRERGDK